MMITAGFLVQLPDTVSKAADCRGTMNSLRTNTPPAHRQSEAQQLHQQLEVLQQQGGQQGQTCQQVLLMLLVVLLQGQLLRPPRSPLALVVGV